MQVCRSQASVIALHLLRAVLSRPSRGLLLGTHVDQPFVVRPSFLSRRTLSVQLGDDVAVEAAAGADAYAQRDQAMAQLHKDADKLGDLIVSRLLAAS